MARLVKAGNCPRCGAPWLYALDDDMMALNAKVHPEPLSGLGEVQATLAGIRTFELRRTKGGYNLDWRHRWAIKGRPAGAGVIDVLAEHRCGVVLATAASVLHVPSLVPVNAVPNF